MEVIKRLEMKVGKVIKRGENLFFFSLSLFSFLSFFFFFFFFFLLFTFENDGNLFWVYQIGNFFTWKKHFTLGKKSEKTTLPPQKNMHVTPLNISIFQHNLAPYSLNLKQINPECSMTASSIRIRVPHPMLNPSVIICQFTNTLRVPWYLDPQCYCLTNQDV